MRGVRVVIVAVAALLMVGVGAMAATEPTDTVAQIDLRGYYVDPGVDVDINELERLVASISDGPEAVYFVALDEDPVEGADLFASKVLDRIQGVGTVVVVSPGEIGARSTEYGDQQLNGAIDNSLDALDRSYADGFSAFADALPGASETSGGGGGGGFVFLLIIVVIGALILFMVRRSKKSQEQAFGDRIDEIKAEVRGQLGDVANDILELEDEVLLSDNSQAKDFYATGSAAYAEFEEKLEAASSPKELHDLVDGLDMTQWQLSAAEALVDGKAIPPKPEEHGDHQPAQPSSRPGRADLPPDLQMRRERGQRIPSGGPRPRRRSGGWLGGLGTAATILKGLRQTSGGRRSSPRSRASTSGRISGGGSSGINLPNLGGGRSTRRSSRSSSRSPRPSSGSGSKSMRGRARRKR